MSNYAVKITDLWKRYQIGQAKSTSFRENFGQWFKRKEAEYFWALREIEFEVKKGEAVGIIGKNGAGKSTLLKVLSKITYPTKGRIEINGRISSLLEVGTGFHPELTGRQNVFLNGSILGMTKREIQSKFDEIVDFSGVEKFIDTPVKHYSSGMKVRLAFSVAAHLEPEILIIDEVLAVGDADFQKKCLGKMENVAGDGRTILFVSHNLSAVESLCSRGIVISDGRLMVEADARTAISQYIKRSKVNLNTNLLDKTVTRQGAGEIRFTLLRFTNRKLEIGSKISFNCTLNSAVDNVNGKVDFGFAVKNEMDTTLIHGTNRFISKEIEFEGDQLDLYVEVFNILKPGLYTLVLFIRVDGVIQDWIQNAGTFEILDGNPYGYTNTAEINGLIFPKYLIDLA